MKFPSQCQPKCAYCTLDYQNWLVIQPRYQTIFIHCSRWTATHLQQWTRNLSTSTWYKELGLIETVDWRTYIQLLFLQLRWLIKEMNRRPPLQWHYSTKSNLIQNLIQVSFVKNPLFQNIWIFPPKKNKFVFGHLNGKCEHKRTCSHK